MKPSAWLKPVNFLQILLLFLLACFWISELGISARHSEAPFDSVLTEITKTLDKDLYPAQTNQRLKRSFSLDPSQFSQIRYYRKDDAMNAEELVLIQYDDPNQKDQIEESFENRKANQIQVFSGYAPSQEALTRQAVIDIQGNYALYYVGSDPTAADEAFLKGLEA